MIQSPQFGVVAVPRGGGSSRRTCLRDQRADSSVAGSRDSISARKADDRESRWPATRRRRPARRRGGRGRRGRRRRASSGRDPGARTPCSVCVYGSRGAVGGAVGRAARRSPYRRGRSLACARTAARRAAPGARRRQPGAAADGQGRPSRSAFIGEASTRSTRSSASRRTSYEMWALTYDYLVGYSMKDMSPAPGLATKWTPPPTARPGPSTCATA